MAKCSLTALLIVATVIGATGLTPSLVKPKHRPKALAAEKANEAKNAGVIAKVCGCKNWKQTYQNNSISCGSGQEFFFKTGKGKPDPAKVEEAKNKMGDTICKNFYEMLDFNMCVNLNIGKDEGQWCYVDPACTNLNAGGKLPNIQLNWKRCEPGQDTMLRDLSPEDLNKTAHESDLELGLLHKMAYPLSKAWEGKRFPEVSAFWGVGRSSADTLPKWVKADMQKIADSGKPYSFDNSLDEHTPHTIVVGKKVYNVVDSPQKDDAHPGTWETLECIAGC